MRDIDWKSRTVRVLGKGRKEAEAPFGPLTEQYLKAWLKQSRGKANTVGNIWGVTAYGIVSMLRRLEKTTGITCNPHVFRRTFACLLRQSGVDTMTIQNLGRWESIEMVQRYTRAFTFRDSLRAYKAPLGQNIDEANAMNRPYERNTGQLLVDTIQQWLYIEDVQAIHILFATVLSNFLHGDNVWLFFIGPPGGTKTELLRAFQHEVFYGISTLTAHTLVSGLNNKGGEVDLMPKLDGKILVIKDFTSILSKDSQEQAEIFGDLRDAYDGYIAKAYGSGVGKKTFHARFGVIAAVTPAIDMFRVLHGMLGERFLKCRIYTDEAKAIDRATQLMGKEVELRESLPRP